MRKNVILRGAMAAMLIAALATPAIAADVENILTLTAPKDLKGVPALPFTGEKITFTTPDLLAGTITAEPNQGYIGQEFTLVGKGLPANTAVSFYNRSAIIASAHTFEYVGAGTTYTALPQYGGIPIEANEVIQVGGGVVTFTSTDQKGNFKVGPGFVINQATGVISGNDFYQSLFAQMTPYILALGSN